MTLIAGMTVSVDYADMFQYALPSMLPHFDKFLVLTTPEDAATQELCRQHGADCLATDAFFRDGAIFNRGQARNEGLERLDLADEDWLAFVDGDMVLPANLREYMRALDPQCIYGIQRLMVLTPADWQDYLRTGECRSFRLKNDKRKFWMIVGFFQLFQTAAFKQHWGGVHPVKNVMEPTDLRFSEKWGRDNQRYLDGIAFHLGPDGVNWHGRKSERFA